MKIFRKHKKTPKSELHEILEDYQLPSFPVAVMNVLNMLRDPESPMTEVTEQLLLDPGMHILILKTVNSAAFGFVNKVSNVHHATTLLGRSRLETIVLSHAVESTLPTVKLPNFNIRRFWVSAARRACLARVLADRLHPATNAEAFTAGLLQDMAVPVLATVKQEEYSAVLGHWYASEDSRLDVLEKETFGLDHPNIGALMAEEWNFPEYLVRAISRHHERGEDGQVEPAIELVSLIRESDEGEVTDILINSCQEILGIGHDMVLEMINKAFEDAVAFSKILK